MVICVSGYPGSGKTTLSTRLARELGYPYRYGGGIFREMAAKQGLSIEEFYKSLAENPDAERDVDRETERIMNEEENLVIDSRVAPFLKTRFLSVNILLTVSPEEGARRERTRPENAHRSNEEMVALAAERMKNEREHYRALHGIENQFDPNAFDIVLDTTTLSIEEEFWAVWKELQLVLPSRS